MFGDNIKRKPLKGDGTKLEVKEIFATIQGEGNNAGVPAVFLRLGGCNLACDFCDTEFENYESKELSDILTQIENSSLNDKGVRTKNLVVITGGEPFRQPIEKLCDNLVSMGFKVQIETNGTIFRDINKAVEIVCSPKNVSGKYTPIREDLLERVTIFKFLLSKSNEYYLSVPELGQSKFGTPVYVQPIDEYDEQKNLENYQHTVKVAKENGYRLSFQMHKFLHIK